MFHDYVSKIRSILDRMDRVAECSDEISELLSDSKSTIAEMLEIIISTASANYNLAHVIAKMTGQNINGAETSDE